MNCTILLAIIGVVLAIFLYTIYVGVIQKRNRVEEAFSGIDVHLKKRYDLIPNILTIAQKFMEHERGLFGEITALRTQAMGLRGNADQISKRMDLDKALADKMHQLMVNVENYPQLKSDATMMQAMQTYSEVEEHIAAARRFYNSAARELKDAVNIFPSSMVAAMLGIKAYPFFEASEQERQSISATDYLK